MMSCRMLARACRMPVMIRFRQVNIWNVYNGQNVYTECNFPYEEMFHTNGLLARQQNSHTNVMMMTLKIMLIVFMLDKKVTITFQLFFSDLYNGKKLVLQTW